MAKELSISELGDPIIRSKASSVKDFKSSVLQELIDNMLYTVEKVGGMGIAAPQVGQSIALILITPRPNIRYPHAEQCNPIIMINPSIKNNSLEIEDGWEGCLTIPGIRGLVPRFKEITVSYFDRNGEKHEVVYKDFIARVIQHEYDHLEGKVFIDRVQSLTDLMTDKEWRKRVSR